MLINGLTYKRFDPFRIKNKSSDIVFNFRIIEKIKKIDRTKDQFVEKKPASTTIFDFKKNCLHALYLLIYKTELEKFRFGPYLLAPFLSSFSAAMIHCSSILRNGKAIVFLAPDEGGKTTAVKLASEGIILCDDQNIIKKENNKYNIYGTPWGMTSNNLHGPVGAFFIINKSDNFKLTQTHPDILLSYLWNEHLPYHFFLPKEYSQKHFNFLFELSRSIPVYQMHSPINYIDWNAIDAVMIN